MSNQPPYTEYPRPSYSPGGGGSYHRGPGIYFDAIGEAWNLVRSDFGNWIAGFIVTMAIYYALVIPIMLATSFLSPKNTLADDYLPRVIFAMVVQTILILPVVALAQMLCAGLIGMAVRQSKGEYINVGMIFEPFKRFGPNFLASLLCSAICTGSAMACILPALFFGPVLALMPAVAYLKEVSPMEALSITFNACKRHWFGLFGLLFISGVVSGLGVIACCIGILFTAPIYFIVLGIHYRAFFESSPNSAIPQ